MRRAIVIATAWAMTSQAAFAAPAPALCTYLTTLLASAPDGFARYKGMPSPFNTPEFSSFAGTLPAPRSIQCKLYPKLADPMEPAQYTCQFLDTDSADDASFKTAQAQFDRMSAQLKVCFPRSVFGEHISGDAATRIGGFKHDLSLSLPPNGYSVGITLLTAPVFENLPSILTLTLDVTNGPLNPVQ